jgi:hypothetical protein
VHLIALPVGTPPDSFVYLAEQACAGQPSCRFIGWSDSTRRGRGLPLSRSSADAISFSYVRRESAGPARVQWNCAEFPRAVAEECLRRGG